MSKRLYVASQDEVTRKWHTIAMLTKNSGGYEFIFTKGVKHLRSIPGDLFRMNTLDIFKFDKLIPILKNRLPPKSRPDFFKMAKWLNLSGAEDEFTLLSRFGLIPGTDALLLYPEPELNDGLFTVDFFVHGIRHMHSSARNCCDDLSEGDRLLPVLDIQNPVDPDAVAIRSNASILVGYVPAFYAWDFSRILCSKSSSRDARITIIRNNKDAPDQLRLLCKFSADVGNDFELSKSDAQQPLASRLPSFI